MNSPPRRRREVARGLDWAVDVSDWNCANARGANAISFARRLLARGFA